MRKIKHVLFLLSLLIFCSCRNPVAIEKYCGWIVVYTSASAFGGDYFILKKDTALSDNVHLLEYDFDRFNVGDSIKCK